MWPTELQALGVSDGQRETHLTEFVDMSGTCMIIPPLY